MNMNPMMMNMNMNKLNEQKDKGKEIILIMRRENKENNIFVNCYEGDKASILREKCNANEVITFNYKPINEYLSIKENGISNNAIINLTSSILNVSFSTSLGNNYIISLDQDCPVSVAIIFYCLEKKKYICYLMMNYLFCLIPQN